MRYVDAERLWSAALEEAEEFGVEDLRFATSLNNLASLYQAQGKYAEAEPHRGALERAWACPRLGALPGTGFGEIALGPLQNGSKSTFIRLG